MSPEVPSSTTPFLELLLIPTVRPQGHLQVCSTSFKPLGSPLALLPQAGRALLSCFHGFSVFPVQCEEAFHPKPLLPPSLSYPQSNQARLCVLGQSQACLCVTSEMVSRPSSQCTLRAGK